MPHVFIVVVNWNNAPQTLECLRSLNTLVKKTYRLSVIIVDNASTDGSVKKIQAVAGAQIQVMQHPINLGFTGGNNAGIRSALAQGADYVWLLNNDTIVAPDALESLLVAAKDDIGVVGSKIYFAPGHEYHPTRYAKQDVGHVIWYAGGIIDWANMYASHRGVDEVDTGQYDDVVDTDFVTGCSMLIKRQVFEHVGLFDEKFFLYLEDVDFSLRALRYGFRLVYAPRSVVWHYNAGSTSRPGNPLHRYYLTRNRLLIGWRWAPIRTKVALLREALRFLIYGKSIEKRAVTDALMGKFGNRFVWQPKMT